MIKKQNQGFISTTIILIIVGIIIAGSGTAYLVKQKSADDIDSIACTEEAKKCSDGSFVSRIAPDCEFAKCPDVNTGNRVENQNSTTIPIPQVDEPVEVANDPTANWKTYRNEEYGFEMKYPKDTIIEERNSKWANILIIVKMPNTIYHPTISILKNTDNLTLLDEKKIWQKYPHTDGLGETIVGERNAFWYTTTENGGDFAEVVSNDYIYRFSSLGLWQKYNILSTFKFID